jgi:hypothetical protein
MYLSGTPYRLGCCAVDMVPGRPCIWRVDGGCYSSERGAKQFWPIWSDNKERVNWCHQRRFLAFEMGCKAKSDVRRGD